MNNIQKELKEILNSIHNMFEELNVLEDSTRDLLHIMKRDNQKFKRGDVVRVDENRHHKAGVGVVLCSYADEFGGGDTKEYTLYLKCFDFVGQISWYNEKLLTMIRANKKENITITDAKCEELLKDLTC